MSRVERTGRSRSGRGCRWCGSKAETVVLEVRDTETGGIGSEAACCLCGKHQHRWGWERQFWAEETRKEIACGVLVTAWLAARIIQLATPLEPMSSEQAAWIRENVWPPRWLRDYNHIPGVFLDCACQRPPSVECQMDRHSVCRHDGHPINETVIETGQGRAARIPDPYEHRPPAGRHGSRIAYGVNDLAWVWLAGAPCREICTCVCHRPHQPAPTGVAVPVQLDLFAGAP